MKGILILLLSVVTSLAAPEVKWANGYDQDFSFSCENHQSISRITSLHDNHHEDRIWDFRCQDTFSGSPDCSWSGYVNDMDQPFSFTCPFGSVLRGMGSYHDNRKEDRRWDFLCCHGEVRVSSKCEWSTYVNDFDEYLNWDAPTGYYLTGAESYHDNKKEDRRWKYRYCKKD